MFRAFIQSSIWGLTVKSKGMTKGMTNWRGVAVIVFVLRADTDSESEDNERLGICLEDPRLARGEEARQLEKYYDRIVFRTPRGWYNLMPPEKVAIGLYFKNLLDLTAPSNPTGKHLLPDLV